MNLNQINSQHKEFNSADDLLMGAKAVGYNSKVPEKYRNTVYLYFIARVMVSYFQIYYSKVPIQVWNEHRNALDHLIRYFSEGQKSNNNLKLCDGHLQRSVLDITKIICHETLESIKEKISKTYGVECLSIVDNGNFFKQLMQRLNNTENAFKVAKIEDSNLGTQSHHNEKIISMYLVPAFDSFKIEKMFLVKTVEIQQALEKIRTLKENSYIEGKKDSEKEHQKWWNLSSLKQNIFSYLICGLIGVILSTIINYLT